MVHTAIVMCVPIERVEMDGAVGMNKILLFLTIGYIFKEHILFILIGFVLGTVTNHYEEVKRK